MSGCCGNGNNKQLTPYGVGSKTNEVVTGPQGEQGEDALNVWGWVTKPIIYVPYIDGIKSYTNANSTFMGYVSVGINASAINVGASSFSSFATAGIIYSASINGNNIDIVVTTCNPDTGGTVTVSFVYQGVTVTKEIQIVVQEAIVSEDEEFDTDPAVQPTKPQSTIRIDPNGFIDYCSQEFINDIILGRGDISGTTTYTTKSTILNQGGTATLAQANVQPQAVLGLLG
jgi:hypothetical protein